MPFEMDSKEGILRKESGELAPCGFPGDLEELERRIDKLSQPERDPILQEEERYPEAWFLN